MTTVAEGHRSDSLGEALYTLIPSAPPSHSKATPLPDRPLKAGEDVLQVKPFAVVPIEEGRCERCLRRPGSEVGDKGKERELRMCGRCRCVGYCSETCQSADIASHKPLCPSLPSLNHHLTALTFPGSGNNAAATAVTVSRHDILTALMVAKIIGRYCNPSTDVGKAGLGLVQLLIGKDPMEIRRLLELVGSSSLAGGCSEGATTRPDVTALDTSFLTLLALLPAPGPTTPALLTTSRLISSHLRLSRTTSIPSNVVLFLALRFPSNAFILSDAWGKEIGFACVPKISRGFDHACGGVGAIVTTTWGTSDPTYSGLAKEGLEWPEHIGGLLVSVRTIKPIAVGEEITIAYLDPILAYADRQRFLSHRYGFDCICSLCTSEAKMQKEKAQIASQSEEETSDLGKRLHGLSLTAGANGINKGDLRSGRDLHAPTPEEFMRIFQLAVGPAMRRSMAALVEHYSPRPVAERMALPKRGDLRLPLPSRLAFARLPVDLMHCLEPQAVTELTTLFSDASNGTEEYPDGNWTVASVTGAHILAVYVVVYGWRWPLIGLHLFELAKTLFNAYLSVLPGATSHNLKRELLMQCKVYLGWAEASLTCSGAMQVGSVGGTIGDKGPGTDLSRLKRGVEGDLREFIGR